MKMMKHGIAWILTLCLALSLVYLPALGVDTMEIEEGTLELVLEKDDTRQLTLLVTPEDADISDLEIFWESSDEKVATVSDSGFVTAVGVGEATITVTVVTEEGDLSAICQVIVAGPPVAMEGVAFAQDELTVTAGKSVKADLVFSPADATNRAVTWSSEDESVATVKDGVITGVAVGETTVTVTTEDGGFTASCAVTVAEPVVYTVTFDSNGGSAVEPAKVEAGETVTKPSTRLDGCTLTGWTLDGAAYDFSAPVSGDITLVAQWKEASKDDADTGNQGDTGNAGNTGNTGSRDTRDSSGTTAPAEPKAPTVTTVTKVEIRETEVPLADLPGAFRDVTGSDWYYNAVAYVADRGLMNGTPAGEFEPDGGATRGMVVTVLYRLAGSPAVDSASGFKDVKAGAYYADAVAWASANGIVQGFPGGTFQPDQMVSREQLAAILYRYAAHRGDGVSAQADLSGFVDASQVNDYAKTPLSWAVASEFIQGYNSKLVPNGTATRAQFAAILMRMDQVVNG